MFLRTKSNWKNFRKRPWTICSIFSNKWREKYFGKFNGVHQNSSCNCQFI